MVIKPEREVMDENYLCALKNNSMSAWISSVKPCIGYDITIYTVSDSDQEALTVHWVWCAFSREGYVGLLGERSDGRLRLSGAQGLTTTPSIYICETSKPETTIRLGALNQMRPSNTTNVNSITQSFE
jgi:hypothetical protein